ncbi:class II aldolase/adducin family protein [Niveibacterium sp. 24ML]|uniref:class II aldolase/adducin family protein n=1 Tax=Niveibacterium sp. 24ML TaxID=2985512 RepID=UPI0022706D8D|nr:class II aldolase/adducin family protein [Niveibacterium sp. 24ML]MCX9156972.1 class II aldolase/adducin family protein [Niveibacterium sp. 24ML]
MNAPLREQLLACARHVAAIGLNPGAAGNLSLRTHSGMLITPSGLPWEALGTADFVEVDASGQSHGQRAPSSEWMIHRDLYLERPDIGAVIHTHAPFCTALACLHRTIPPFHYMVARFGGADVRCADYATYGTPALSQAVMRAMGGRNGCLMANHGMIVAGHDLRHAQALAIELESLAEQYWRACQLGAPVLLPEDEIARVLEKFKGYGVR